MDGVLAALGGSAQRPARSRFPHSISAEEAIGSLQAQFGIAAHLRALHAPRHSPSRSPVRAAGPRPRRLPPTRSPTRSPTRLPLASRVAAQPAEPKSEAPAPEATTQVHGVFQRVRSASEIQADEAMAKIRSLQAGLFHRINSSSAVLKSAEKLIEECGQAILSWFGSLSGPALDAAIREAFERFDADSSGFIDRGEFAHAMHTMGMRLAPDQYDVLFKKCDVNKSGEIDLEEFTHMIRIHLKKACAEDCRTCEATGGSNQPDVVYRPRWVDDESLLSPAASKLQNGLVAALTRQDYAEFKDDPDDFWSDGSEDSGTGTGSVRRFRRSRRARTRTRESELEGVAGDSSTRKKHSQVRPYKPDRGIDSDLSFDEDDGLDSTTTGRASVHGGVGESETVRGQGENGRDYDSATSFDSQTTGIEKAAADAESPSSSAANMANKARRAVSKATSARDAAMAAREAAVAAASSASSSYTAAERQALQDAAEAAEQAAADAEASAAAAAAAAAAASTKQIAEATAARRANERRAQLAAWKEQRRMFLESQHAPKNFNLNHDADQIIFRDASFLTADAPQYERKFARRPSTQMSLDATEDSDGHMHHPRIASMFDIMPGPLPPLARGTLVLRQGLVLNHQRPQTRDKGARHISFTATFKSHPAHPPPATPLSTNHDLDHRKSASAARLRLGVISRGSSRAGDRMSSQTPEQHGAGGRREGGGGFGEGGSVHDPGGGGQNELQHARQCVPGLGYWNERAPAVARNSEGVTGGWRGGGDGVGQEGGTIDRVKSSGSIVSPWPETVFSPTDRENTAVGVCGWAPFNTLRLSDAPLQERRKTAAERLLFNTVRCQVQARSPHQPTYTAHHQAPRSTLPHLHQLEVRRTFPL